MCCLSHAQRTEPQQDTLVGRGSREGWALQGSPTTSHCCQVGNIPGGQPLPSCARGTEKAAPSCTVTLSWHCHRDPRPLRKASRAQVPAWLLRAGQRCQGIQQ